jgi:hypothetical protein
MVVDSIDVCSKIKQPAHAADDGRRLTSGKRISTKLFGPARGDFNTAECSFDFNGSQIASIIHHLNARRPRPQKTRHVLHMVADMSRSTTSFSSSLAALFLQALMDGKQS